MNFKDWPLIRNFRRPQSTVEIEPMKCLTPWLDSLGDSVVIRSIYKMPDGNVITVDEDAFGNRVIDPPGAVLPEGKYQ